MTQALVLYLKPFLTQALIVLPESLLDAGFNNVT